MTRKAVAWQGLAVALVGALSSTTARAEPATAPQAEPAVAAKKAAVQAGRPSRRDLFDCRCSVPHLVKTGRTHDWAEPLGAWRETQGPERLVAYAGDPREPASALVDGLALTAPPFAAIERRLAPVRVLPNGGQRPAYVGFFDEKRKRRTSLVGTEGAVATSQGKAPKLRALYAGPREEQPKTRCGRVVSLPFGVVLAPDSAPVSGWVVRSWPEAHGEAAATTTLVDERYQRVRGLGFCERCDQGVDVGTDQAAVVEVRPFAPDFAVGAPTLVRYPAMAGADTVPVLPVVDGPPGVKVLDHHPALDRKTRAEEIMSDEKDRVAGGAIVFSLALSVVAAALGVPLLRRRRAEVQVTCPVCSSTFALDSRLPEADGMFCPRCGKSAVFLVRDPAGRVTAEAVRHRERERRLAPSRPADEASSTGPSSSPGPSSSRPMEPPS